MVTKHIDISCYIVRLQLLIRPCWGKSNIYLLLRRIKNGEKHMATKTGYQLFLLIITNFSLSATRRYEYTNMHCNFFSLQNDGFWPLSEVPFNEISAKYSKDRNYMLSTNLALTRWIVSLPPKCRKSSHWDSRIKKIFIWNVPQTPSLLLHFQVTSFQQSPTQLMIDLKRHWVLWLR